MVAFFIPEMTPDLFVPRICKEFSLQVVHVSALARLLAEGATVPFIARYRKEEKRERGQSTHSNKIGLHGGTGMG